MPPPKLLLLCLAVLCPVPCQPVSSLPSPCHHRGDLAAPTLPHAGCRLLPRPAGHRCSPPKGQRGRWGEQLWPGTSRGLRNLDHLQPNLNLLCPAAGHPAAQQQPRAPAGMKTPTAATITPPHNSGHCLAPPPPPPARSPQPYPASHPLGSVLGSAGGLRGGGGAAPSTQCHACPFPRLLGCLLTQR